MRLALNLSLAACALALIGCATSAEPQPSPTPTAVVTATPTPTRTPSPTPTRAATPSPTAARPSPPMSHTPIPTPTPTPTPSRHSSTPPTAGSGEWKDVESQASSADEAQSLAGVPKSFRTYVAAAMSSPDTDGCTTTNVSVMSVHPSGFVLGSESSDCGGGQVIWAEQGGGWQRLFVMQAPPLCEELESASVPPGVGLQCLDGESLVGY